VNEQIVGAAHEREAVEEWALVLAAADIEHRVEESPAGWRLLVPSSAASEATAVLAAYERDGVRESKADELDPGYGRTWIGLWLAGLIIGLYAMADPRWIAGGRAAASRILAGEVWRTVTALGLHQDLTHLVGNAAAIAVFGTFVGRTLGPGLAVALLLIAGAVGNALSAVVHGPGHTAVGASTAIFGAIGVLGGLEFVRRRRLRPRGRAWIAIAGSLALLGMLGTSERADLAAHLHGLVVGTVLGAGAAVAIRCVPGPLVQGGLVLVAAAVFAICWMLALR
jgi:membrane associated rhomboid family serine protease